MAKHCSFLCFSGNLVQMSTYLNWELNFSGLGSEKLDWILPTEMWRNMTSKVDYSLVCRDMIILRNKGKQNQQIIMFLLCFWKRQQHYYVIVKCLEKTVNFIDWLSKKRSKLCVSNCDLLLYLKRNWKKICFNL